MKYAKWSSQEDMKKYLKGVNLKKGITNSGIPIMYDDEYLYIDDHEAHSLVVGSTGCGKTQSITLPMIKMAMMAGENIILNDIKGELYRITCNQLEKSGYEVLAIDFEEPNRGNCWNPLKFPYQLYKAGDVDRAIEFLDDVAYYIFSDSSSTNDPFWVNSTIDYFTGLALYLFENGKEEEINLTSIFSISSNGSSIKEGKFSYFDMIMSNLDKNSSIYYNLSGTLLAPPETKGSIISVFNQKMKRYITHENLSNMLASSDFDLRDIGNKKIAIFIISGKNTFTNSLIPLFVNQTINSIDLFGKKEKMVNLLMDEFDSLLPIRNFGKIINYARGIRVRFTVFIRSFIDLNATYGVNNAEIIKMCFGNIIYLLANDLLTLEEISKMCGNKISDNGQIEPLITVEELKVLDPFEAVVIIPRKMPFKTKLLPDYEIDYGYDVVEKSIPTRKSQTINTFDIKKSL